MTVDEMESFLEQLGVEPLAVRNGEVQARCPAHKERTGKEDHNPSWFINAETGAHICFSCHFKGSLPYLVSYLNKYYGENGDLDFDKAKEWISGQRELGVLLDRALTPKVEEAPPVVDPAMLAAFVRPPAHALKSRGLTLAAAEECNLLWEERSESWIIPIYDGQTQTLLGWQQKAYRGRFFKNYPPGMKKSESLYGYIPSMQDQVVLVESPLDVVRLRSLGIYGVASYGSFVSKNQLALIRSAKKLIIALDNDPAGVESNQRIIKLMPELWFEAWFFDYSHTDQKDVGGMSRDEVMVGLQNAEHYIALLSKGA